MSIDLGYAISSVIFIGIFAVAVVAQIAAKSFHPFLYWAVIVATTTAGTTMADFADRSLGIGYAGGTSILFVLLMASLAIWYRSAGSVSVATVTSPKVEMFYWGTILFSQTLGTALGDWMAAPQNVAVVWQGTAIGDFVAAANEANIPGLGLGYEGGALVFGAGLLLLALAYFYTSVSRTVLFWSAFILTRPLGATVGDLLDKPLASGGLALSRFYASAILAAFIVACIVFLPQRAGRHPGERQTAS